MEWTEREESLVQSVLSDWLGLLSLDGSVDAEDLAQELRLAALELKAQGELTEQRLRDRARRILRDYGYRGRQAWGQRFPVEVFQEPEVEVEEGGHDHSEDPDRELERAVFRELLYEWMDSLSEEDRALLEDVIDQTYAQVGAKRGVHRSTAWRRARRLLQTFLDEVGYVNL